MKTTQRQTPFLAGLAASLVLGLAAAAWACTVQARIIGLSTPAAVSGSDVEVRGEGAQAGVPVAIFWNDTAAPQLAGTVADAAGNFSAVIRIPESRPGIYYILAVPAGGVAARSPFQVTSPAAAETGRVSEAERSTDLWSGFAPGETGIETGQPSAVSGSDPGPADRNGLGIGLLAFGAIGLVAGLGAAVLKRRPASAS